LPAAPLECDSPLTRTVPPGAIDTLAFSVVGDEIVSFVVVKVEPSQPFFEPEWRVVNADGTPAGSCGSWTAARGADCGPLPQEESPYRLLVRDRGEDASGTYKVHLQRLTDSQACEGVPMNCGDFLLAPINDPTDTDLIRILFAPDDVVTLSVYNWDPPGPDFTPEWRLLQADGSPAAFCGTWTTTSTASCGPLPAGGNPYRIEVRDFNEDSNGICHVDVADCSRNTGGPRPGAGSAPAGLRVRLPNPLVRDDAGRVPVTFEIPRAAGVTLEVFDASGRLIDDLAVGRLDAGRHARIWPAPELSPGLYFPRVRADELTEVVPVVVIG
jgi:hypothetical protein